MKLAIVAPYPFDINKITGGVEAVAVYLVEGLRQIDDLDIHIISCKKEITKEKIVEKGKYKVYYLPSARRFGNITLGIADRYKIRKKIREINPDIIHSQSQSNYSYAALQTGYPTVITAHGILYKEVKFRRGIVNYIRMFPIIYIERICQKRATDIISISPYVSEMFNHLTKAKIYSIENPISDKYFQIENIEVPDNILFVGSIIKLKNVLDLLKVVNILKIEIPRIELRIAGDVRESYYFEALKSYIKKTGLENNVSFLGQLSENQILKEYGKCCLSVLTSFQETAPMVIQQAMAAGKAVVSTRVGGVPYLVENGKTGFLVDSGDIKNLAEKIKLLISDNELRRRFGENAKQEALKRFKTEIVGQKTYQVYQEILNKKV